MIDGNLNITDFEEESGFDVKAVFIKLLIVKKFNL